jgi:hypothetical protein
MTARTPLAAILLAAVTGCVSHPPTIAHVHIGHAVTGVHVTPGQKGYFQEAEDRAREVADKARAASASKNLDEIKGDVASVVVATESKEEFGLKHALVMAANHISFAATSPDASLNVQQSAPVFTKDITRVVERCDLITLLGKDVASSTSLSEATVLAGEIGKLAAANLEGEDTDGDGKAGTTSAEFGIAQLRVELDAMIAREKPPYRTVEQWYLFNLVKLPNGVWVFDKLGRGGNIEGYQ